MYVKWHYGRWDWDHFDILNLVQNLLKKKKNQFQDSRPNYPQYYGFGARHPDKLEKRKETLLGASHSKVTKEVVDDSFKNYLAFLKREICWISHIKIHNTDETGFTIGNKTGVVLGPTRQRCIYHIPHSSDKITYASDIL